MKIRSTFEWKDEENFPGVRAVLRALGAGALLRLQEKIEAHVSAIETLTEPFQQPIRTAMDEAEKQLPSGAVPAEKERARIDAANTITIPAQVIRKITMEQNAIDHEYLRVGLFSVEGVEGLDEDSPKRGSILADYLLEIGDKEVIQLVNALITAIKAGSTLTDAERKN